MTVIQPASIDTPLFQHARAKLPDGKRPRPLPPVCDPQLVTDAILRAAMHPARSLTMGGAGAVLAATERLAPHLLELPLSRLGFTAQETADGPDENAQDSLFTPTPGPGQVRGDWGGGTFRPYAAIQLHPTLRWAATAAAATVGGGLIRRAWTAR